MTGRWRGLTAIIALGAALIVAGCGDDGESAAERTAGQEGAAATATTATTATTTAPTTPTAPAPAKPKGPTRVRVVLGAPGEFSLVPTPRRIPAGPVVFTVVNRGTVEHELVILKTARRAANLAPEQIEHGNEKGRINKHPEHQEPGTTMTIRVNMRRGHYSMICNVEGHYQAGQYADFIVTEG